MEYLGVFKVQHWSSMHQLKHNQTEYDGANWFKFPIGRSPQEVRPGSVVMVLWEKSSHGALWCTAVHTSGCLGPQYSYIRQLYRCAVQLYTCSLQMHYTLVQVLYSCTFVLYTCTGEMCSCACMMYSCTCIMFTCTCEMYGCTFMMYKST